jgi:uncharacterized damage-inducible protein DinB
VATTDARQAHDDLRTFYRLVRATRGNVLDWLDTLPTSVYLTQHPEFAFGSLRAIYGHVVATYVWWAGHVGLGDPRHDTVDFPTAADLRRAFDAVDEVVARALDAPGPRGAPFTFTWPDGARQTLTRRWTILHPITHEFHHKGQALALGRVLGHPYHGEPDADLVPEEVGAADAPEGQRGA